MWNYEKRLEYPVNITTTNPKLAQLIISQYGGRMVKWVRPCAICHRGTVCLIVMLQEY